MPKIFVIVGKSASGKDSVFKELINNVQFDFKTITGYTTRPPRKEEQEGVEYYFVSNDEMKSLEKQGKIIESRTYSTINGEWSYFTVDDGQIDLKKNNYIIIGTLDVYHKLEDYYGCGFVIPLYIEADDSERLIRSIERERMQAVPNYKEICRRFLADEKDFSEENIQNCRNLRRYNNSNLQICTDNILEDIRKMV